MDNLAFELGQLKGRGFIFGVDDYSAWKKEFEEAWESGDSDPIDGEVMLAKIKNLTAEQMAELILRINVYRLRQQEGEGSVAVKDLATYMGISVSTLYRVYGKAVLRASLLTSANENLSTDREERTRAEESKFDKGYSYRASDGENGDFRDD